MIQSLVKLVTYLSLWGLGLYVVYLGTMLAARLPLTGYCLPVKMDVKKRDHIADCTDSLLKIKTLRYPAKRST